MSQHVTPYQSPEEKKKQVSNMFDNISGYYDFLNHFLSLGIDRLWRRSAIAALKAQKPALLLDVATGTADLAIEAHKQLAPIQIKGIDISPKMLNIGREKIAKLGLSQNIELIDGDAENLPFESNTFDAMTVAFGVRNYENLDKGLSDMLRVLKPGATLAVLEFSKPTIFPFKQLFQFYFRYILPTIGRFTSKDPRAYAYLYESVQAFPDGKLFESVLQRNGYENIHTKPLSLGICSLYTAQKPA
jgi:demethylmenaquinone methyltransferase/2-methoxy-6-polyprenyl-1,4-benzoquinol methylase